MVFLPMMIKPFYSQTGGMQAEKCGQVKRVLTIFCGWYLIIVESLNGIGVRSLAYNTKRL